MSDHVDTSVLENVLRADNDRFRELADLLPHIVWTASPEGECDFLSKRWGEFTGVPAAQQLGRKWVESLHPDDRLHVLDVWKKALASSSDFNVSFRIRRRDGEYRWFDTRATPLRNSKGELESWLGTNTDVHEAVEARRELAENEERLRYVTLATHDAVYDWDLRAGRVYRNDQFQFWFGAPAIAQANEKWWEQRIHPEDRQRVIGTASAAFRARQPMWSEEYRFRRIDGHYAFVADRAYLLYDSDKKPLRMIGAISDITERKQAEQSMRDMQSRLLSALEGGAMATWIWDIQEDRLWWDDAAYRLWGRSPAEFGTHSLKNLLRYVEPDDRPGVEAVIEEFYRTGIANVVEFRVLRPDNKLQWLQVRSRIEHDANGQPIRMAGIYLDITDRKRQEAAQLRTQKMEALGTLAGGIAHDFNNILLAISGNAKLAIADLQKELRLDHPVQKNLSEIEKASTRGADLVRRILTFSRQQDTQLDVVHLRPLVEDALRLLRPTLPASVDIRSQFDESVVPVAIDAIQVQQVVMNLVTNAAHAIGDHAGSVSIALSNCSVDGTDPTSELPVGRYACLTVTDTGSGIEPNIIDRIFDPFFTTKKSGQGTGLGLAVVHGIVKAHGGAITVHSEAGKGTSFRVFFPAATSEALPTVEPDSMPPPQTQRTEHVLYVDDEEPLVFLITRVLERQGYRVTGCVDPEEALKELRADPNNVDVLVTDLSMRGMNGFELTREAHKVRADLPVLLTSGYLRAEDRDTAEALGIRELILKPNTVEELGQAIDRTMQQIRSQS